MGYEDSRLNPRQDARELIRATLEIVRCHLIGLLIVWLALFAPVMCQYHGLMVHFGGETTPPDHTNQPDANGSQPRLQFHETASQVTVVIGLFAAVTPGDVLLPAPVTTRWAQLPDSRQPSQLALPIPDQPPRQF